MVIHNFKIKNVKYNLNDIRLYFVDNYPNTIHMFLMNNWYKIYNDDAEIISNIFNYKIFDDSYSPYLGNICCGFPNRILEKIKNKLQELKINFNIIDTSDYTYEYYDFELQNNYHKYHDNIEMFDKENVEVVKESDISQNKSSLYVEIGDKVSICNSKTNEIETYTIEQTYHTLTPIGFSGKKGYDFGKIVYKDELLTKSNVAEGIILSESELAKKLLGAYLNSTLLLIDDNLEECIYRIVEIKKHQSFNY